MHQSVWMFFGWFFPEIRESKRGSTYAKAKPYFNLYDCGDSAHPYSLRFCLGFADCKRGLYRADTLGEYVRNHILVYRDHADVRRLEFSRGKHFLPVKKADSG